MTGDELAPVAPAPFTMIVGADDALCDDDGCAVPAATTAPLAGTRSAEAD